MDKLQITHLSSKGQIVLPQLIRERMKLGIGVKFIVLSEGDTVILKKIEMPSLENARRLLIKSRRVAKKLGLKPTDIPKTIVKIRKQAA